MQQPEALDSKTFPVMAGSSFVRMSDGQVLPLQLLIIFFSRRPAASGPRAEALALVLPDSELPAIEPSRLWETRAGYRNIPIQIRAVDVMAGGGGGAGPAPLIRHQEPGTQPGIRTIMIYTQKFQ